MRLKLLFKTKKKEFPSDNRKVILSWIKKGFTENGGNGIEKYYGNGGKEKEISFSLFFPNAKFTKEKIIYDSEFFILNFTTPNMEEAIEYMNSFLTMIKIEFNIPNGNTMTLEKLEVVKEKTIVGDSCEFRILSPLVVRDRIERNKDWYYTFEDDKFEEILKRNLKSRLKGKLEFDPSYDIDELKIMCKSPYTKTTRITNFKINYPVTIGSIYLEGKNYLLDYLSKSGSLGSRGSQGFNMIEVKN